MKLIKKIKVTGTIELLTGLHIGASNDSMQIGGYDSVVVRNPLDNRPYIPGSSLKGKLRSLIEISDGTINNKNGEGDVANDINTDSVALFGNSSDAKDKTNYMCHASRLIVRDAVMINVDEFDKANVPLTEGKTEAKIDRITSKAMPRTFERVPRGAKFGLSMIINVMDFTDDIEKVENSNIANKGEILSSFNRQSEANLKSVLDRAFKLLADDYLGGQGSRGYGEVKIDYKYDA